jgi:hypothetical protein
VLTLTPFEAMDRFSSYAEKKGVTVSAPLYFGDSGLPECTGWSIRHGEIKIKVGVERDRDKRAFGLTLDSGPLGLHLDSPPPHEVFVAPLGEMVLGDEGIGDFRIEISEADLARAFSKTLAHVALVLSKKSAENP